MISSTYLQLFIGLLGVFEIVVVVAIQSVFHLEMHQNKKNIFDIITLKRFQKI